MDEDSIALTAFTTPFGLFEYLYMTFGLTNASATFQRFIDHVLQCMSNAIAYVDDIIVFSNSRNEHDVKHLNELFSRLKNFVVIINLTKSQFRLSKLPFLGHVVTANGMKLLPSEVEAIQKYPLSKDAKQLRTYLGMINFYHRFVQNLAFYLAPLEEYSEEEGN